MSKKGDPYFKVKKKNINEKIFREYNIINNKYWKDHKRKFLSDRKIVNDKTESQLKKTKIFNILNCEFYDKKREKEFQRKRVKMSKNLHKKFFDKLPYSYKVRETF